MIEQRNGQYWRQFSTDYFHTNFTTYSTACKISSQFFFVGLGLRIGCMKVNKKVTSQQFSASPQMSACFSRLKLAVASVNPTDCLGVINVYLSSTENSHQPRHKLFVVFHWCYTSWAPSCLGNLTSLCFFLNKNTNLWAIFKHLYLKQMGLEQGATDKVGKPQCLKNKLKLYWFP